MFRSKVFKRFILPGPLATVLVGSAGSDDSDECKNITICRRSELPIYCPDPCERCRTGLKKPYDPYERGMLEETIGKVRQELWVWYDQFQGYRGKVVEVFAVGKAHTENTMEYLKVEENYLPRAGAIGLSGIAGLVFGLRGGWFKRITYASVGSAGMAALCYPRHTAEISNDALIYAKKYLTIGYNFVYGVKPSDQPIVPALFGTGQQSESPESAKSVKKSSIQQPEKKEVTENEQYELFVSSNPVPNEDQLDPGSKESIPKNDLIYSQQPDQVPNPVKSVPSDPENWYSECEATIRNYDQSDPRDKDLYTTRT